MTENDPQLPENIRRALKDGPTFTPPESFYRGVLEKTERRRGRADGKSPAPWYQGLPIKSFATVCTLSLIVLMTRDARKSKPALFQSVLKSNEEQVAAKTEPTPPASADLANSKEVQDRLNRNIVDYVGNPSPFEDLDEEARKDIVEDAKKRRSPALDKAKPAREPAPVLQQARDTMEGAATQDSFRQEEKTLAKAPTLAAARAAAPQSIVAGSGGMLSARAQETNGPVLMGQLGYKGLAEGQQWKGAFSAIVRFRTVAVRTPDDWQALWQEHSSYIVPPPPVPPIDFSQSIVVGVFAGRQPSGGYSVDIIDIQTRPDKLIVRYRETFPPAGQQPPQVATQPYCLRQIPKTDQPVTFIKLP